jgi:hypothetical protein
MSSAQSSPITRRALLRGASALSVLALIEAPAHALGAKLDSEGFLKLSRKLLEQTNVSKDIGDQMLNAFTALGKQSELAGLAAGRRNDELASKIVASWYTGESPDPASPTVLSYTDSLIWDALDYTKPMGYCGGATGYWSEPPEE